MIQRSFKVIFLEWNPSYMYTCSYVINNPCDRVDEAITSGGLPYKLPRPAMFRDVAVRFA